MNVATVTFAPGLALTGAALDAGFLTITQHQISRADFIPDYAWGVDIDMDGFGFTAVRHVNGYTVYADQFLDGDDADSIQAAINFVNAVGGGTVVCPDIGAAWDLDGGIILYGDIHLKGLPGCLFENGQVGTTVTIQDRTNIHISGIHFRATTANVMAIFAEDVSNLLIEDCLFGDVDQAANMFHSNSCITIATNSNPTSDNVVIRDNEAHAEGPFVMVTDDTLNLSIRDNLYMAPGVRLVNSAVIKVSGDAVNCEIKDNYLWNYDASIAGQDSCVWINGTGVGATSGPVLIEGNTMVGSPEHLLLVNNAQHVVIKDNDCWNAGSSAGAGTTNTWDCCRLDAQTMRVVVDNNIFTSLTTTDGGPATIVSRYGIYLHADCEDIVITNNFLEAVAADSASTAYHHGNCNIAGFTGAGFYDSGAAGPIIRHGNTIIEDQVAPAVLVAGAGPPPLQAPVLGVRQVTGDADRYNQILGVFFSAIDPATGAAYVNLDSAVNARGIDDNAVDLVGTGVGVGDTVFVKVEA